MTEKSATTDSNQAKMLLDPSPRRGEHPGGPRRQDELFPIVAANVREHLSADSPGHHVWRVFRLTQRFVKALDADRAVVGCGALLRDLHRVVAECTGCDPEETFSMVEGMLAETGLGDEQIGAVKHCVEVHDELGFRGEGPSPETIETKILHDADNLDAMGAVGVARTFAFGGVHGTPPWDPTGEGYSQLYHFEHKLLRLRKELHTDPARQLAQDRHAFLEMFFDQFGKEWHGEM